MQADERYLSRIFGCLERAYARPLRAAGYRLTTPRILMYAGSVQTPCGSMGNFPPFYCSANETVYFGRGALTRYGQSARVGGYWIAFHEYAHHVQKRVGILAAAYGHSGSSLQTSRRIELQAECFGVMTGTFMRSTRLNGQDRQELRRWRLAVGSPTHGKGSSQWFWTKRGFSADDFGDCNTWAAGRHVG